MAFARWGGAGASPSRLRLLTAPSFFELEVFHYLRVRAPGRADARTSGLPGAHDSGRPCDRATGRLVLSASGHPEAGESGCPGYPSQGGGASGPDDARVASSPSMSLQAPADRCIELRHRACDELAGRIVTVMSGKGGVGKTLLSLELAWLLDAVLTDLDWDGGGATRGMGYLHEKYKTVPILDAYESGKPPKPKRMSNRPDLVPSHPDLEANQLEADDTAKHLVAWAQHWQRGMVCDTHPGGSPSTLGACAAADLVVMPVVLGTRELNALEQTLEELGSYPLLLVPNWVPFAPPAAERQRLRSIAGTYGATVSRAVVREYRWMRTRKVRTVVTAAPKYSARSAPVTDDMLALAGEVLGYAAG